VPDPFTEQLELLFIWNVKRIQFVTATQCLRLRNRYVFVKFIVVIIINDSDSDICS